MKPVLETPRLVMRELAVKDLDFLAAMLAHPEVMRYWPGCLTREEAERWIARQRDRYRAHGCGYWLVLDKQSRQPVGQAGVLMLEIERSEEPALGYMMHFPFWGKGYATEAAAGCCDWVFATLGRSRIVTPIRPENGSSLRVAEKLGLKPSKVVMYHGYEHQLFIATRETDHTRIRTLLLPAAAQPTDGRIPSPGR